MENTLTVVIRLYPTKEQKNLIDSSSLAYINLINELVEEMVELKASTKKTTANIVAPLNSSVKNQALRDSKSVFKKAKKTKYKIIPVLKKTVCVWNNQNYSYDDNSIAMPFIINGKSKKVSIKANITDRAKDLLSNTLGTLRITKKGNKYMAQISVTTESTPSLGENTVGVDLGILVPAVAYCSSDKVKFFGNGRKNKYTRRRFKTLRQKLGKLKKPKAIKTINNKEQRIMNDLDHKVSRDIVNFAKDNNASIIKLEQLSNIRKSTRTSRKNAKNIHNWSFYRLSMYIEYKARLHGIIVEYVNPAFTSQTCPSCSIRNKAKGRSYACECGYQRHRDLVGAINISRSEKIEEIVKTPKKKSIIEKIFNFDKNGQYNMFGDSILA